MLCYFTCMLKHNIWTQEAHNTKPIGRIHALTIQQESTDKQKNNLNCSKFNLQMFPFSTWKRNKYVMYYLMLRGIYFQYIAN